MGEEDLVREEGYKGECMKKVLGMMGMVLVVFGCGRRGKEDWGKGKLGNEERDSL